MRKALAIGAMVWLLLLPASRGRFIAVADSQAFMPGVIVVGGQPDRPVPPLGSRLAARGWRVARVLAPLAMLEVQVPVGQEQASVDELRHSGEVAFADLNYVARTADVLTPTDPGWANQWGPTQINVPAAWAVVTGTPQMVIATIDSGLQLTHEDLASQRWLNAAEVPGNNLDYDLNGYVDDVNGWHFFQRWNGSTYAPDENANVADDYGHGTHVAGIIAAAYNGTGVVGVAPGVRVMPVKVIDQFGNATYSDIAAGIVYAVDNGARIINLSLGGEVDSPVLQEPIEYARLHDVLVIAATGNSGGSVLYPAAYDSVLAVAATDISDHVAAFSNYGPEVDLAAPGVDIYSTWCRPNILAATCDGSYYFTKSGTSMAAPHVSGAAALVWSRWPNFPANLIAQQLRYTADDIEAAGQDVFSGFGRVNADRAVNDLTLRLIYLPLVY